MRDGQASVTAQRVAAHRLTFDRVPADYGDPGADEQLSRDVAGDQTVDPAGRMVGYLAARTAFFDRTVRFPMCALRPPPWPGWPPAGRRLLDALEATLPA